MLWVILVLVLALAALATLIAYGVWLAHKTADVLSELGQLADRAVELGDLVAQIQGPGPVDADPLRAERSATHRRMTPAEGVPT